MQLKSKSLCLIAAASFAAGCAKQDYQMMGPGKMGPGRQGTNPKTDPAYLNAEEEKVPKILPDTHYAAGMLFEQQGQVDKAILQYRKAVALNHNFAAAYNRLGLTLSAVGQHDEAIVALSRAAELRPQNPALRNNLGFEYILAQRWDDAEFQLEQAIENQPTFARAHVNLGLVRARTGRFDEALECFRQAMAEPDAYYNLGLTQRGQQKYNQAADSFRRVLELNPDFSAARVQLDQLVDKVSAITPTPMPVVKEPQTEPSESIAVAEATAVEPVPCEPAPPVMDIMQVLAELIEQPVTAEPTPAPEPQIAPIVEEEVVVAEPTLDPIPQTEMELVELEPIVVAEAAFVEDETPQIEVLEEQAPQVEFVEEPTAFIDFVDQPTMDTEGFEEPTEEIVVALDTPAPCEDSSEEPSMTVDASVETDADEVIVLSVWIPVEPLTQPIALLESWEMLNELEQKIAALRRDLTEPPTFVLASPPMDETFAEPTMDTLAESTEATFFATTMTLEPIVVDEYIEQIEENEPTVELAPQPIEAPAVEESREEAIPGDRTSEWSQSFGELSTLLAFVIDESNCLNAMDAEYAEMTATTSDATTEFVESMPVDVTDMMIEEDVEELRLVSPFGGELTSGSPNGTEHQAIP